MSTVSGKRGSEVAVPIRVVRPRYDIGFNYEEARAKSKDAPGGYPRVTNLPEVRPAAFFNPSSRLSSVAPKVSPKKTQGPGEQFVEAGGREEEPKPKAASSVLEYAKPTPKLRGPARAQLSRQRSEQASPEDPLRSDDKPEPLSCQ